MQISHAEVIPIELKLRLAVQLANTQPIESVSGIFLRVETQQGESAWGCTVAHPLLTGEDPVPVIQICQQAADLLPDLHPTNIEYSLSQLAPVIASSPGATCAFDLVFHDLLGLASGLPLHRLLGGFRNQIPTSVTIPLGSVSESVKIAQHYAAQGFRILKIKGGCHPADDVRRVRAIHRALPNQILRLDPDGGYDVQQSLDVPRILEGKIQLLEQPTPGEDLDGLRQVTQISPVPVLADQSIRGPNSALALAAGHHADGLSIKLSTCGGLRAAQQVDAIARAARLNTMVSCVIEPALLVAAGLSFALSSPNVTYADLDGHLDLINDPTMPGFNLEDGCLVASEVPGLGCSVNLD